MSQASMVQITSRPAIADIIQLRNIQLLLPTAPDSWHRPARPQPCTASIRASYASSVASAAGDDVNLTIDYGKLYRQLEADIGQLSPAAGQILVNADGVQLQDLLRGELGEDVRLAGGIVAKCCLQQLEETAVSHCDRLPCTPCTTAVLTWLCEQVARSFRQQPVCNPEGFRGVRSATTSAQGNPTRRWRASLPQRHGNGPRCRGWTTPTGSGRGIRNPGNPELLHPRYQPTGATREAGSQHHPAVPRIWTSRMEFQDCGYLPRNDPSGS